MNSNSRKLVFFIVLVALAWFAYIYMIKPANAAITQQRSQINTKIAKLAELEKLSFAADDAGRQLAKLSDAVQFFRDKLPPESEIHKVLESITLIAQKQGLNCDDITALKSKVCNGYIEQPLKMELNGSFQAFYQFLIEIEKLQRIINIGELELKKDINDASKINSSMTISIFFSN